MTNHFSEQSLTLVSTCNIRAEMLEDTCGLVY